MSELPKMLPCRKCGSQDAEMWNGFGTQADLVCNECGQEEGVQVRDLFVYEPRPEFNATTFRFPESVITSAQRYLIEEWNKRSTVRNEIPSQAEIDGVAAVFESVADDPLAAGSAYIMAKKLKRVFFLSPSSEEKAG